MRKLFTLSLLLITVALMSQDKVGDMINLADVPESKALVSTANEYASAIVNGKYENAILLTNSDIIEMGGGEEFAVSDLRSESQLVLNQGFKYVSHEVGNHPEFLMHEGQLQTVIPVLFRLSFNDKDVEAWSQLYAVSADEGKTWTFADLGKFDATSFREFVKGVSPEFVFPTQ